MPPKYEWFGVGWEAWGALAWDTNQRTVIENVSRYLDLGFPLRWMVIGSGFWPRHEPRFHATLHELPLADLGEQPVPGAGARELPIRQPLRWTRVHDLPDFVYFNHSIHVKKGVGCATCHGRVDRMPLMYQKSSLLMEWCLECHRNPERFVRPREAVFQMDYQPPENQLELGRQLVKAYDIKSLTNCSTCHR